jgi:hypothetical protein
LRELLRGGGATLTFALDLEDYLIGSSSSSFGAATDFERDSVFFFAVGGSSFDLDRDFFFTVGGGSLISSSFPTPSVTFFNSDRIFCFIAGGGSSNYVLQT